MACVSDADAHQSLTPAFGLFGDEGGLFHLCGFERKQKTTTHGNITGKTVTCET